MTYNWRLTSKPANSQAQLLKADFAPPSFTTDVAGFYELALVVSDGHLSSNPSTTIVTASANATPVAVAGSARTVSVGSLVALDGTGSNDANGDVLSYS